MNLLYLAFCNYKRATITAAATIQKIQHVEIELTRPVEFWNGVDRCLKKKKFKEGKLLACKNANGHDRWLIKIIKMVS